MSASELMTDGVEHFGRQEGRGSITESFLVWCIGSILEWVGGQNYGEGGSVSLFCREVDKARAQKTM